MFRLHEISFKEANRFNRLQPKEVMKTKRFWISAISIAFTVSLQGFAQRSRTDAGEYSVGPRGADFQIWERTSSETSPDGTVVSRKHRYVELATGLNYQKGRQWVESKEEIDLLPQGGASATQGQHQVYFPGDIYQGVIEMVTPDGKHLKSRPLGLSYSDGNNGVLIAQLKDSVGMLVAPNQIVYPDAFTDIKADLRYTYTKSGFEQDVILRESPLTPESYGLEPSTARLQVMTEFFDPPHPNTRTARLPAQAGIALADETLSFGKMEMVPGRAFLTGPDAGDAPVKVAKRWLSLEGRQFLIEEVPVEALVDQLVALPGGQASASKARGNIRLAGSKLQLPAKRIARKTDGVQMLQLVRNAQPAAGLVLDYQTVSANATNITFQADTTYYISSSLNLFGTNTFEGGTVVKYAAGAGISVSGSAAVNWQSGMYRPVIFTAKDDNTIGENISGSTGTPSGYYANPAVGFSGATLPVLSDFRILYAQCGVLSSAGGAAPALYNGQFINCQYAAQFSGSASYFRNILFANVQTNFVNLPTTAVDIQQSTFNNVIAMGSLLGGSPVAVFSLTNCVVANVTNYGAITISGANNGFYNSSTFGASASTTASNPFQTVGGGNYYLANGSSFRGIGTTVLDPTLSTGLRQLTTYPPTVYSNVAISAATTLGMQVRRETNGSPDLGYHYYALDYVFGGCDLFTNLTLNSGTAIAWFENIGGVSSSSQPYGMSLNNGANLTAGGTATQPVWVVQFQTAQENVGPWSNHGWMSGLMLNGASGNIPQINGKFMKWSIVQGRAGFLRDNWAYGVGNFSCCEAYGGFASYRPSFYFTNTLFYRAGIAFWDQTDAASFTFQNCTFYNGGLAIVRYAGQSASFWNIKNTAFDGTAFIADDNFGGTNYTAFDYNAYNSANTNWIGYNFGAGPAPAGTLEVVGPHDVTVSSGYGWQSSWLGNFYLPPASTLVNVGSTTADLLGFYHFTTLTNQVKETNSIIDIGYHYVATDVTGNPLDSNGNGTPDYLEDAGGAGQGLTVSLVSPVSGTYYHEPANIPLQATVSDWRSTVTNVAFVRGGTITIKCLTNVPYSHTWPVVSAGAYSLTATAKDAAGSTASSSSVSVTVTNLCGY